MRGSLSLLLALAVAAPATGADAVFLMRRGDRAERTQRYSGTKLICAGGAGRDEAHPEYRRSARIWHDGPGRTRLEILRPDGSPSRVLIENGRQRWFYFVKQHAWRPVAWRPPEPRLDLLLRNYRVRPGPVEAIAGRRALRVWVEPRFPGNPRKEAWLDLATGITLRADLYDRNGRLVSRSQFLDFAPQRSLPASLFMVPDVPHSPAVLLPAGSRLQPGGRVRIQTASTRTTAGSLFPPGGRARSEAQLDFAPALPRYLPPGYVRDRVVRTSRNGSEVVRVLFTDGLNMLSLVQWRGPGELPDAGRERFWGPGDRIRWDMGPVHALLAGDLDGAELKRIVASVGPSNGRTGSLATRK